ncbi:MAG: hypothetical protein U0900_06630 [Myxococcota bacterium]
MVEACHSIDINRLHRSGCLVAGWVGALQWTRDGEKVASISLRAEIDRLNLTYRSRVGDGDLEDIAETVRIVRINCRLGGTRPYFICPGVVNGTVCGRRVASLYCRGRYFLCRYCYRLSYSSQSEDVLDRSRRRARKIWRRLGGNLGFDAHLPSKPKGMWWRTYRRLRAQAVDAEMRADLQFEIQALRLLDRIGTSKGTGRFWE